MNLKKSVYFNVCGEEICLDVTWHMLEKVERVYGMPVDVVPFYLQDAIRVPRSKVAEIISLWVQEKTKLTRDQIKEHFFTCQQSEYIKDIGKIQACVLWSLRGEDGKSMITDAAFDKLVNGIDLDEVDINKPSTAKESGSTQKKPRAATSKKRTA